MMAMLSRTSGKLGFTLLKGQNKETKEERFYGTPAYGDALQEDLLEDVVVPEFKNRLNAGNAFRS